MPYDHEIINFVLPFIDYAIINITNPSGYEKTTTQPSTTTRRKSTNDQNGPKRKSKNKSKTQMIKDEVSVTDTQQQTSEH